MFQGNWKCSVCGGAITELPFEPRSEAGLTCRTCYAKSKDASNTTAPTNTAAEEDTQNDVPDFDEGQLAGEAPDVPEFEGASRAVPGERKTFSGEWTCSVCGGAITSLPFEPRSTANLKCIDCFKAGK